MKSKLEDLILKAPEIIPIRYGDRVKDGYAYVNNSKNLKTGDGIYTIRRYIEDDDDFYMLKGPFTVINLESDKASKLGFAQGVVYLNSNYSPSNKFTQDLGIVHPDYLNSIENAKISYYLSNAYSPHVHYSPLTKRIPTPNHFEVYKSIGFGHFGIVPKKLVDKISDRYGFVKILQGDFVPVVLYDNGKPIVTFPAIVSSSGDKIQIPYEAAGNEDPSKFIKEFDTIEIVLGLKRRYARKLI